jgi:hypothetical protein
MLHDGTEAIELSSRRLLTARKGSTGFELTSPPQIQVDPSAGDDPSARCGFDGERAHVGCSSIGELSFPSFGERSRAMQAVLELEAQGVNVTIFFDLVVLKRDRAISILVFGDAVTPFLQSDKERIVEAVADRMERTAPAP